MELVKINKISINKNDYFEIDGILDLENLSFQFNLSLGDYFTIFKSSFLQQLPIYSLLMKIA